MKIRHQLPVYSPLTLPRLVLATAAAVVPGDLRARLIECLRSEYRADDAMLLNSGTDALQHAIGRALDLTRADAVALPAFSCYAVGSAAVSAGASIRLYDVDPDTLGPDYSSLEKAMAAGARVVVVSPLYGMPIDWDEVRRLERAYEAVAIEDAAQGNGARWRATALGALGSLSVVSFGRGKGWTGGRGGALLLRSVTTRDGARPEPPPAGFGAEVTVAVGAWAQWILGRPWLYGVPSAVPWLGLGETVYRDAPAPREICRAAAGLALRTQRLGPAEVAARQANAKALLAALERGPHLSLIQPVPGGDPGYLRLPVRLARGMAGFASHKDARQLGIAPSYPLPLAELTPVRNQMAQPSRGWPGATELARSLVTLPTHSRLRPRDLEAVAELVNLYSE